MTKRSRKSKKITGIEGEELEDGDDEAEDNVAKPSGGNAHAQKKQKQ